MPLNRDYRDLFAELNAAGARFLLVGAHALAFHGRPGFTKDLDVWVEANPTNAERVVQALLSFGAPADQLRVEDFSATGRLRDLADIEDLGIEDDRSE